MRRSEDTLWLPTAHGQPLPSNTEEEGTFAPWTVDTVTLHPAHADVALGGLAGHLETVVLGAGAVGGQFRNGRQELGACDAGADGRGGASEGDGDVATVWCFWGDRAQVTVDVPALEGEHGKASKLVDAATAV